MSNPAPPIAGSRQGDSPWLYGRLRDVFFGYGLAYLVSVPLLLALAFATDTQRALAIATPYLALVFSTPHYGATILRVYENREDRQKYALFSIWITLGIVALFVAGLYSVFIGSLVLTIYVSWSPWHFSGQNYGVSVMYLGRSGVRLTPELKRLLYLSYVLSAVLAFLSIHIGGASLVFAAGSQDVTATFRVLQLGIPTSLAYVLVAGFGLGWVGCIGVLGLRLLRMASPATLAPVAILAATQSLWFTLPAAGRMTGIWNAESLPFTAIWLSVAHSTQYLWVTCFYIQREGSGVRLTPFLVKSLLAGAALSTPALVLAPGLFGPAFPNAAAVGVLLFSLVNLHHFILDGAIWKLRDGRIAQALLRSESIAPEPIGEAPRRAWLRPVLLGFGALCVVSQLYVGQLARVAGNPEVDAERSFESARMLSAFGGDTAGLWSAIARRLEDAGEPAKAMAAYGRSVELGRKDTPPWAANRLAWLLLAERPGDAAALEEARRLAVFAARRVGHERPEAFQTLAAVHAAAGRWEDAGRAAERALEVARSTGDEARVRHIERTIAQYQSQAAFSAPPAE
ncbi:MAG: tetratricopeptide repeat protein [Myxococcota bacterium]